MKKSFNISCFILALVIFFAIEAAVFAAEQVEERKKILIVSSYHREYLWSQDTQKGVCAGLIEYGFLDNVGQATDLTDLDYVKNASYIVKKIWMDTKRKNSRSDIGTMITNIVTSISKFKPDLILLGDDNAANYIGNQYIDSGLPIVFWGINGIPLKYGLIDSLAQPGHNVTGVYQAGYLTECLTFLKTIVPKAQTFAILSDDSPTGRSKAKELKRLSSEGKLPLKLKAMVVTNSFSEWKKRALELQSKVDSFFILNHNSITDDLGNSVDQLEIGSWYLRNIKIPECAHEKQFAQEGMLCVCDDSGYNQGYQAVKLANRILNGGENPADITIKAPPHGPFILNRERAKMLGIATGTINGVDQFIDKALALEIHPEDK